MLYTGVWSRSFETPIMRIGSSGGGVHDNLRVLRQQIKKSVLSYELEPKTTYSYFISVENPFSVIERGIFQDGKWVVQRFKTIKKTQKEEVFSKVLNVLFK